uniref:EGF-like domain-containing protein n=1 Tax=Aegilops tauschii subsp. strangulata TaxID=200361 RepID=A0A453PZS2_AEGTS
AVPVILDWAVRNVGNCSAAKRNTTDYACQSALSDCVDSKNGIGYHCNCSKGYEGNPYLQDGCKGIHYCPVFLFHFLLLHLMTCFAKMEDINECKHKEEQSCYGVCANTLGSHTCQCPPGTRGDATTKTGCRPKDNFTLALKVVTGKQIIWQMCCSCNFTVVPAIVLRKANDKLIMLCRIQESASECSCLCSCASGSTWGSRRGSLSEQSKCSLS